jgi:hypothetical protein
MFDPKLSNLIILKAVRIGGAHVEVGTVIAKDDFGKDGSGDWKDMVIAGSAEETNDKVGAPIGKAKSDAPSAPKA